MAVTYGRMVGDGPGDRIDDSDCQESAQHIFRHFELARRIRWVPLDSTLWIDHKYRAVRMLISREPAWRRNLRDYVLVVNEAVHRARLRHRFQAPAEVLVANARAPKCVQRSVLILKLVEG